MNPITSATMSGIGQTPLGAVEGTWVVGFFTDNDLQQPTIMGSLPGVPRDLSNPDSKKPVNTINKFPAITDYRDLLPIT